VGINLDKPLAWKSANDDERKMLADLQANILKPHGRPDSIFMLLRFNVGQEREACAVIRELSQQVTSAQNQLYDTENFKATGRTGRGILSILLSASGYRALRVPADKIPHTKDDLDTIPFSDGMKKRSLGDPKVGEWEENYRGEIHAMIILADTAEVSGNDKYSALQRQEAIRSDAKGKLETWCEDIKRRLSGVVDLVHVERGHTLRNGGEVVEHFGFVDGISQVHMLQEDIEAEIDEKTFRAGSPIYWNPHFPLSQVLVKDPGSPDDYGYGSYVVFRKLEQNVRAFRRQELEIAGKLELPPEEADLVGGMLCGRMRDGGPVVVNGSLRARREYRNNFSYSADAQGSRCPLHAHVRKINSRSSDGVDSEYGEDVRSHLIVRRSTTYGSDSFKSPSEVKALNELDGLREGGVGVLFLAYQHSIRKQFEYIQANWANLSNGSAPDPFIGQLPSANEYKWPTKEGDKSFAFTRCVTLKGGEYFFAPSIRFLKDLEPAGQSDGLQVSQTRDDQSSTPMEKQIYTSTRSLEDETKPRKNILEKVETALQKIRQDPNPEAVKTFQKMAVAAIHNGRQSKQWREYMEMLLDPDDADLRRLMAEDGTESDPEISTSRAYLVANAVCGSDTTMRTGFGTNNIDKDFE
jgi:Dyp-type peroxidase family